MYDNDGTARHWIGGQWRDSAAVSESVNPANGEVVGEYADGGRAEAVAAVAAARRAFASTAWSTDRDLRRTVLTELAAAFDAHAEELARVLTAENGKLLREARLEARFATGALRYAIADLTTDTGSFAQTDRHIWFSSLREPLGVVAIIVPWESPIALLLRSLGPALAAGNAVAVKLPGQTALTNALMARIISEVPSLPAGVVNMFTESGNTGAPFLAASSEVDAVSYTGSTAIGRLVVATGAVTLKRMNMALGGKTPMILFEDADLDHALPLLTLGVTLGAGQFCMAGSRILVHRSIADRVRARLSAALESVVVGPGDDEGSQMGPLVDRNAVRRVDALVEESLEQGGKAVVRGGPVTEGPLAAGAFYRPSLIEIADLDATLVQEEVFGPVATFEVFDDEAEAVYRANATEFGLAAAVFTRDGDRARRVGRAVRAGTVWTNSWFVLDEGFPEGGVKQSGLGRLRGPLSLAEFQETKTYVHVALPETA
ncbi:aldehyde dehydrogenase family protein [Streptomyces sp. GbtcB6]|uniref:aldehyde dehydrogenase family protein n=1 Tax=Streptomyces sp. GbtcB6 TaxID=2824751 RepID=UPI001C2FDFDC|nr:aldehyde dehydrogenase family protein [Streptomyces sp. GbtcB6]